MRALTVEARSLESARGLYDALARFHPQLGGSDEQGYRVTVELGSFNRQVVAVLNAIEEYVSNRDEGAARVELDGRTYTVHAAEAGSPPEESSSEPVLDPDPTRSLPC